MIKLTKFFDLLEDGAEVVIYHMDGKELFTGKFDNCPMCVFHGAYVAQMRYIEHSGKYHVTVKYI